MATARAQLSDYRQSPRKVRLVANDLRGKKVSDALVKLDVLAKRSATPLAKLIRSAVANARTLSLDTDTLTVKEIRVDEGKILYRRRPASRGRAHPIRKRTSHILVTLEAEEIAPAPAKKTRKKAEKASS